MEDEEHTHHDAHFQEELGSLKVSMARMLEQTLRNTSGESPSNRFATFI
jgi:hypothetical protein